MVEKIPDDDNLLRRVPNAWRSKRHPPGYIPSKSFKFNDQVRCSVFWDNPGGKPFSIDDARTECLTEGKNPANYGIIKIGVLKTREIDGLDVIHHPYCADGWPSPAHANIKGESAKEQDILEYTRLLRRHSKWVE